MITVVAVFHRSGRGPFCFGADGTPGKSWGAAGHRASPCGLDPGWTPRPVRADLDCCLRAWPGRGRGEERRGEKAKRVCCGWAPAASWVSPRLFGGFARASGGQAEQAALAPLGTAAPACDRLEKRQSERIRKAGGEGRAPGARTPRGCQ